MIKKGISILISSYNGELKFPATLEALAKLDISDLPFVELVIVDNASKDNTTSYCSQKWEELGRPFPLQILQEPNPGKLNAQETGLKHVKGEYILLCDDDNSLYPDYLKIGLRYFEEHPEIGVLGGRGLPVSDIEIPAWFDEFDYYFACAPQAPRTGNVNPTRNVVYGAGMWFRKPAYDKAKELGFKFILSSRTGESLSTGGEDSELCWAIKMQGYEIWYIDEMQFLHHVPPSRLTEEYRARLIKGMFDNGPYGKLYIRAWRDEFDQPVKFYWLKEALYTIKHILLLPLNNNTKDFKRAYKSLIFLIRDRSGYDKKVNDIAEYRRKSSRIHI